MADLTLLSLLHEVRGKTLRVLEEVTATEAGWAPPGLQNTILWHAGHSYVVVESLTMKPLGRTPELPEGWYAMFSWESRPAQVPANRWPPLFKVIDELVGQHQRLRLLIESLTEAQLANRPEGEPARSVRESIVHGLHDEARHSGEISLLMKLQQVAAR